MFGAHNELVLGVNVQRLRWVQLDRNVFEAGAGAVTLVYPARIQIFVVVKEPRRLASMSADPTVLPALLGIRSDACGRWGGAGRWRTR